MWNLYSCLTKKVLKVFWTTEQAKINGNELLEVIKSAGWTSPSPIYKRFVVSKSAQKVRALRAISGWIEFLSKKKCTFKIAPPLIYFPDGSNQTGLLMMISKMSEWLAFKALDRPYIRPWCQKDKSAIMQLVYRLVGSTSWYRQKE